MSGHVFVPGEAKPKGSASGFPIKRKDGSVGVNVTNSNPDAAGWQAIVSRYLVDAVGSPVPYPSGPVAVTLTFVLRRTASEPKRRTRPMDRKPDLDKITRTVFDAMTGIVFRDDSQITWSAQSKRTAEADESPGVRIEWGRPFGWQESEGP